MNTVSVTDLRQDATNILNNVVATQTPTYVIQNSHAKVVILDALYYANLQNTLEDYIDSLDTKNALKEPGIIPFEKYMVKRFGKNYANLYHQTGPKRSRSASK
ncbi:MAG: type II toxin-antitoxin system Phd/YefM family antitoxin [Patescibacteria group bacterium]